MKIGIDARFLTHPQKGGFKTYTENLILALAEVDPVNQYYLYLDREPDQYSKIPDKQNFTLCVIPSKIPLFGMLWREQVLLPRQAKRDNLDLLHSPCLSAPLRTSCKSIITIHDVIWLFPDKFNRSNNSPKSMNRKLQEWYYRLIPQLAVKNASSIITVSEYSKGEIVKFLGLSSEDIFVTYEAAGCDYRVVNNDHHIATVREKYNLPSEFILAIGSADPRKNIITLLQSYALLSESMMNQYQLVIVWSHNFLSSYMKQQVENFGLKNQVKFLEWVPDEDLALLYNLAELFVFPSRYEGFGLPLLEAMSCGTPIVAANNTSIPEIVDDAAMLVDANDFQEMANSISKILTDEDFRARMSRKGLARAVSFSWEECARQTIDVYRNIFESNNLYGRKNLQSGE